ncbi:MAG TPA: 30S ribosomal protein S4, partial [Candidatus Paceibacterota bacterium]|nr:30S ribosomal protein S4 [Candidatus Paceibacterota bacterium]
MLVGPKYKICKRLGASVFEKCQTAKFQLAEARSPRKISRGKRGGGSDYGAQLLEKQKARFTYGLSESQFSRYAAEAMEKKGD